MGRHPDDTGWEGSTRLLNIQGGEVGCTSIHPSTHPPTHPPTPTHSRLPKAGLASHTMSVVSALPVTTTRPSAGQQQRQRQRQRQQQRHGKVSLDGRCQARKRAPSSGGTRGPSRHRCAPPQPACHHTAMRSRARTPAGRHAGHDVLVVAAALQQAAVLRAVRPARRQAATQGGGSGQMRGISGRLRCSCRRRRVYRTRLH